MLFLWDVDIPIKEMNLDYDALVCVADIFQKKNVGMRKKAHWIYKCGADNLDVEIKVVNKFSNSTHVDESCYQVEK